jgi:hypothetical protein
MYDDPTFEIRGIKAFVEFLPLGCVFYLLANFLAKFSEGNLGFYKTRLWFMSMLVVIWWGWIFVHALGMSKSGRLGDALYNMPITVGRHYGENTIWAWCIVALIDGPRRNLNEVKQESPKPAS